MAAERSTGGEPGQSSSRTSKATREITWGVPRGGVVIAEESFAERRMLRPRLPASADIVIRSSRIEDPSTE